MVGSDGTIMRTADGGASWTTVHTAATALFAADFDGVGNAVAVGGNGTILRSSDRGLTWAVAATSPTSEELRAVHLSASGLTTVMQSNRLYRGATSALWQLIPSTIDLSQGDLAYSPDGNTAIAVGSGEAVLRSENGGVSWSEVSIGSHRLMGVGFASNSVVFAVGSGGIVLRSGDGGATWQEQPVVTTNALIGVAFASASRGVLVGDGGTILRTTSGGI
jgi:photosystem II stability/assembly factor-like uncharacterized protein